MIKYFFQKFFKKGNKENISETRNPIYKKDSKVYYTWTTSCDDCDSQQKEEAMITIDDQLSSGRGSGGLKTVCKDRDACYRRRRYNKIGWS